MAVLTRRQNDLLASAKIGNVYAANELAKELVQDWHDVIPKNDEVIEIIETCRDIIVRSNSAEYCLKWMLHIAPENVISSTQIEDSLIKEIDDNVLFVAKMYRYINTNDKILSSKILNPMIEKLCDVVTEDPTKATELVKFVSRFVDFDSFSDEAYQKIEQVVLASGNVNGINLWDDLINNYGEIKALFHLVGSLKSFDNIKDVHIPVNLSKVKGTPFEKTGLEVFDSTVCIGNDTLWWIDPDSFEADSVVSPKDWIDFYHGGMTPRGRKMPAPISVRDTGEWPWPESEKKMKKEESKLREFVNLIIERKMREADHSSGKKVPFGSSKHVKDLEKRIKELSSWREKHKKGSEKRAHYTRLISTLRQELGNARRVAEKSKK